jgi:hypothetical protein
MYINHMPTTQNNSPPPLNPLVVDTADELFISARHVKFHVKNYKYANDMKLLKYM